MEENVQRRIPVGIVDDDGGSKIVADGPGAAFSKKRSASARGLGASWGPNRTPSCRYLDPCQEGIRG